MNNRGSRRKVVEEKAGTPGWMVTFSDLSTLLLTFFVLILSMSTMDDMTLRSLFHNFTSSSGILFYKEYGEIYKPREILIRNLYEKLKDALVVKRADDPPDEFFAEKDEGFIQDLGSSLILEEFRNGIKLVFGHQLLFPPGSAEIKEEMKPALSKIAAFMRASAYQVYIDGHTDSVPLSGLTYPSNEALSRARAFNLMNYFVRDEGISTSHLALAGYGESHPLASNDTPSGRAKNRRVEIIFKNQRYF